MWNPTYVDFAAYDGVRPWACAPYRPQTKGKVESGVKYGQRNALAGKRFHSWDHLNAWLLEWATTVADVRVHGTTHEVPLVRFAQEALTPLGSRGATVEVHESAAGFTMQHAETIVAEHARRPRQQVVMDPAHYTGLLRVDRTPRSLAPPQPSPSHCRRRSGPGRR